MRCIDCKWGEYQPAVESRIEKHSGYVLKRDWHWLWLRWKQVPSDSMDVVEVWGHRERICCHRFWPELGDMYPQVDWYCRHYETPSTNEWFHNMALQDTSRLRDAIESGAVYK